MNRLKIKFLIALQFVFIIAFAQKKAPDNWFNLDHKSNTVYGISTERAYTELLKDKKGQTVIVAVIDGGTDVKHEDLKDIIWVNTKEIPGNGIDDDGNGYVDDINGWNFIGGKDGNVNQDNLEVTRVYSMMKSKYSNADTTKFSAIDMKEYTNFKKAESEYLKGKTESAMYSSFYSGLYKGLESLKKGINKDRISVADVKNYKPESMNEKKIHGVIINFIAKKMKDTDTIPFAMLTTEIKGAYEHFDKQAKYNYNTDVDSRKIVGDNYNDQTEKYYGNNDVKGPSADHGTHVAGIIAAIRNNNIGMNGVAQNVKIMVVRVVPDGDERDKDVANGIRYAVDNGAKVINMSFGKAFSYNKKVVDDAVKYAMSKDVLIVHAAGNDAKDNDFEDNFPTPYFEGKTSRATGWIEVGASTWHDGKNIAAPFSNYGKSTVDVFAPGVNIYSTIPDSKYASFDGTSMASPVTAGAAALIRSYYPQLTAAEVKDIITKSVSKINGKVIYPGSRVKKVKFLPFIKYHSKKKMSELCATGGIVNVYEALKLAQTYKK